MIITRGFVDGTIITRGFSIGSFFAKIAYKITRFKSYIQRVLILESKIIK